MAEQSTSALANRRQRAAAALRASGLTHAQTAAALGVSRSTVYRWLNPDYEDRQRAVSRAWKQEHRGTCVDCGGPTSLGNARRPEPAERCYPCRQAFTAAELVYWTRERAIEAAQRWMSEHGRPPGANDWRATDPDRRWPNSRECYGKGRIGRRNGWRTWNDFLRAAGLPTRRVGQRGPARRTVAA